MAGVHKAVETQVHQRGVGAAAEGGGGAGGEPYDWQGWGGRGDVVAGSLAGASDKELTALLKVSWWRCVCVEPKGIHSVWRARGGAQMSRLGVGWLGVIEVA